MCNLGGGSGLGPGGTSDIWVWHTLIQKPGSAPAQKAEGHFSRVSFVKIVNKLINSFQPLTFESYRNQTSLNLNTEVTNTVRVTFTAQLQNLFVVLSVVAFSMQKKASTLCYPESALPGAWFRLRLTWMELIRVAPAHSIRLMTHESYPFNDVGDISCFLWKAPGINERRSQQFDNILYIPERPAKLIPACTL